MEQIKLLVIYFVVGFALSSPFHYIAKKFGRPPKWLGKMRWVIGIAIMGLLQLVEEWYFGGYNSVPRIVSSSKVFIGYLVAESLNYKDEGDIFERKEEIDKEED